ncbi:unnamed protein product [Lupinus luteus]|uniref:Pentatricopeptide repeat-containing protein n=1 Tax=Lupinus luteus TaxID=3873 RepID=A0AAV1WNH9_LUPLU
MPEVVLVVEEALELFYLMPYRDVVVFNAMIDGYVKLGCMELSTDLFDKMVDKNVISWISIIYGYCQNDAVDSARLMFDVTNEKTVFTWNAMIGGYCHNKRSHEVLRLFRKMQLRASMEPNEIIVSSVHLVIADLGALDLGGWIHRFVHMKRLDRFVNVCTMLVDMYAKRMIRRRN